MKIHHYDKIKEEARKMYPDNFECPHCMSIEKPSSRKQAIVGGGILSTWTELEDVFLCSECNREFDRDDINRKERDLRDSQVAYIKDNYLNN